MRVSYSKPDKKRFKALRFQLSHPQNGSVLSIGYSYIRMAPF